MSDSCRKANDESQNQYSEMRALPIATKGAKKINKPGGPISALDARAVPRRGTPRPFLAEALHGLAAAVLRFICPKAIRLWWPFTLPGLEVD
jgi:hypothetical protein